MTPMKPAVHSFIDRLQFSEGISANHVVEHLAHLVPGAIDWKRASGGADKSGTDYWIYRRGLPALSIDLKARSYCPIQKWGTDDACVETTSVYDGGVAPWDDAKRKKVGWTLDRAKRTDYIVYLWPQGRGPGSRYWVLPFPFLCRAALENWRGWATKYGERPALNDGYVTLSIYPPRKEIALAMKSLMYGSVIPA